MTPKVTVKIVEIDNEETFEQIPRPANNRFNCQECFYWMEKKDGRTNLVKQKRNWFIRGAKKHQGSLGKLLLWGKRGVPVGYAQFGPIAEFRTTRLVYENRLPVPKGGWCISCVAVQTNYRRRGIATQLVKNILQDLKKRGVRTVDAYPTRDPHSYNQVSMGPVELWEKCGFQQVASLCYGKREPTPCKDEVILMRYEWR